MGSMIHFRCGHPGSGRARFRSAGWRMVLGAAVALAGAEARAASGPTADREAAALSATAQAPRAERPPRKVLVGTVVGGYAITAMPLERRLRRMDEFVDAVAA